KILVNTSETTNMAHFIDTATRQIVANILGDGGPRFAQVKDVGSELWVSSEIGGTVSVIDPVKRVVKHKINFMVPGMRQEAIQPVGIAITHDGKTGFVALGPANRIAVIDATTHQVQKFLLVGQRVWHMAFTPDEKYLLTTNGVSNDVSIIDVAALKVVDTTRAGNSPGGTPITKRWGPGFPPGATKSTPMKSIGPVLAAAAILWPAAPAADAADPRYPDWPCVQAKVP